MAGKLGPALAMGNTVVVKPAPQDPLAVDPLVRDHSTRPASRPASSTSSPARAPRPAEALVESPHVDMVEFTGSTGVGCRIGEVAGREMKRLLLELGGKGAAVVFDDADLKTAIGHHRAARGRSTPARSAPRRPGCIVQRGVYDQLVGRLGRHGRPPEGRRPARAATRSSARSSPARTATGSRATSRLGRDEGGDRRRRRRAPRPRHAASTSRPTLLADAKTDMTRRAGGDLRPGRRRRPVRRRGRGDRASPTAPTSASTTTCSRGDTGRAMRGGQAAALRQRRHQHAAAQPRGAVRRLQDQRRRPRRRLASACTPTPSCSPSSGPADRDSSHSTIEHERPTEECMKGDRLDGRARGRATTSRCATREPHEVRVRIDAAGLCHSDVSVIDGTIPFPTPVVLGHEGAGVVEEVGDAVTQGEGRRPRRAHHARQLRPVRRLRPRPADALPRHVRQAAARRSPSAASRRSSSPTPACSPSTRSSTRRQAVVIDQRRAARRRPASSAARWSPASARCSTGPRCSHGQTVAGHRRRRHRPQRHPGRSRSPTRRPHHRGRHQPGEGGGGPAVRRHRLHRRRPDVDTVAAVKEICPNGVDYAFECVGHPALIRTADRPARLGRHAACCSACPSSAPRPASSSTRMYNDKSILGCRYGSTRPHHDIPLFVDLYQAGRLKLDELVQPDLRRSPTSSRRSTTCTTASSTAACSTFA